MTSQFGSNKAAGTALAAAALLASLGVSVANTALPAIAAAFASTFSEARWVVVAYLLAVTITVVTAGRLGDIFGRREIFIGGLVLFSASSLLCAVAPTLSWLIAARVLQGMGGAASIALSQALVTESVPASRIGSTMGLLGTTSAVGTAMGPSIGGFLIVGAGWRSVFFGLFVAGALAAVFAVRNLPVSRVQRAAGAFDYSRVLRNGLVVSSLAMNSIVSTVMMATLIVGPFYLSQSLGLGLGEVGLVMSLGPCLSILSGIPAGRLVDRLGARLIASLGLALMALGALGIVILPAIFGLIGYAVSIAFLSPGYQLFLAANGTSLMTSSAADQKGMIAGLLNLSRNIGLLTGASGMGAIYAAAAKAAESSGAAAASAQGLRVTFFVAAFLALIALGVSLVRKGRPAGT